MKKLILILVLILSLSSLYAALPANTTTWEVRAGVGNDTNGGAFVTGSTGTDYSQQNAKNSGGADSSTTDAVASGTTTLTSATAAFGTTIPGNVIYLQGGTGSLAAGWYEVVSRTNITTVVLDRSVAAGTGITMNIGGALATVQVANTNLVAGNTVYCKATGSNTFSAAMTMQTLGTSVPVRFIGYTTTRTDNGRVTWTTATDSISIVHIATASAYGFWFQNINFTTTASTKGPGISSVNSGGSQNGAISVINCKLDGFSIAIYLNNDSNTYYARQLLIVNSEITNSTGGGISQAHAILNAGSTFIYGSYIHDNAVGGFCNGCTAGSGQQTAGDLVVGYSIFYANGGIGITVSSGDLPTGNWLTVNIFNSDFVNNHSSGIALVNSTASSAQIWNSIFYGNGTGGAGYGVNMTVGTPGTQTSAFNNAYGSNHDGATLNFPSSAGDVTLSADPFTSIGTDFSLNSTAGGGATLKGTGYPGVLTAGGTGYTSIGALAPNPAGAGGGPVGFAFTQ